MSNKIFTIIICCYNSGEKIKRVIDNILNQEKYEELINEIIIVNNNSNDNTKDFIEKCIKKAKNIRTVFVEKAGLSNARRVGVSQTNSEWIIFLDDDNFINQNWIIRADQYIMLNSKIGAFNGAVLPKLTFSPSNEEQLRLKASLKVLACTHLNEHMLEKKPDSPFRNPIGAGLVIKTEPLKNLLKYGWLNLSGRTKDDLCSGEDGEMVYFIKKQGYKFGFCPKMILQHEIPSFRLDEIYLEKLWYQVGKGVATLLKQQHVNFSIKFMYRLVLNLRLIFKANRSNKYEYEYYLLYCRGYLNEFKTRS